MLARRPSGSSCTRWCASPTRAPATRSACRSTNSSGEPSTLRCRCMLERCLTLRCVERSGLQAPQRLVCHRNPRPHAHTHTRSAHQRFFKLMLMAAKVPTCAQIALDAVRDGMCVVIGLQSTGEANTNAVSAQRAGTGSALDAVRVTVQQSCVAQHAVVTGGILKPAHPASCPARTLPPRSAPLYVPSPPAPDAGRGGRRHDRHCVGAAHGGDAVHPPPPARQRRQRADSRAGQPSGAGEAGDGVARTLGFGSCTHGLRTRACRPLFRLLSQATSHTEALVC